MNTLYQLQAEYMQLLDMLQDPDVDPETVADTIEGIKGEIEIKAENYAIIIDDLQTESAKFRKEAARLLKHADKLDANVDRMKENLMQSMIVTGMEKFKSEHYRFSIVGNGGIKPLKFTGEVPEEYMCMKPEVDNKKIREALDAGQTLDFAYLGERGKRLSIK